MKFRRGFVAAVLVAGVGSGMVACSSSDSDSNTASTPAADTPSIVPAGELCGALDAKALSGAVGTAIVVSQADAGRCQIGSSTEPTNGFVAYVSTTDSVARYMQLAVKDTTATPVAGLPNSGAAFDGHSAWAAVSVKGGLLTVSLTGTSVTAETAGATLKTAFDTVKR
ncbi:hypothetical protein [Gordonia sp. CPCC 205333]|uniref:hypothetical protein n=1 Tax=Gordonia sp. CPCC 205333 TaxID=3140790 RepID=UPI003AF39EB3